MFMYLVVLGQCSGVFVLGQCSGVYVSCCVRTMF